MSHGIYLSVDNDTVGFRLPVNPEEVNKAMSGSGEEYKINRLGSINIPKDVQLQVFKVESFFPAHDAHYVEGPLLRPQAYIDYIERWQKEKKVVRYIYVDGSFSINKLTTIEDFSVAERFGTEDVYFTLTLKEYQPFGPKKMKVVTSPSTGKIAAIKKTAPPRQNTKPAVKTYALVKGDSLWKVAQKFLGNGTRYPEIAKLHNIKSSDYRKLPIGLKLQMPPN